MSALEANIVRGIHAKEKTQHNGRSFAV